MLGWICMPQALTLGSSRSPEVLKLSSTQAALSLGAWAALSAIWLCTHNRLRQ